MDGVICEDRFSLLKYRLVRLGFLNLFIVALLGIVLRSYSFSTPPFEYGKLLHGHSHFAFGGWLMPMMVWLIMQYFPFIANRVAFHHWRNITVAVLVSAYGMLFSFPFQGYGLVSIFFSTLSVLAGFYLAVVVLKASMQEKHQTPVRLLRWGLVYMVLSAIGPFATGPLVAMGMQGSALYHDAIYFYLHFQYNGWLVFGVLAVLYRLPGIANSSNGKKAFYLFNLAVPPSYFLSTLWHNPPAAFYWVGGIGALVQMAGLVFLVKDFMLLQEKEPFTRRMLWLVMLALMLKSFLQLLSAIPFIADMAFRHRSLVIAYLHLVLLGVVSLFLITMVTRNGPLNANAGFKKWALVFITGFVLTESLLVANGLELPVAHVGWLLFALSFLLVFGALGMSLSFLSFQQLNHRDREDTELHGEGHAMACPYRNIPSLCNSVSFLSLWFKK